MAREYFSPPGSPFDLVVTWGRDQEEVQVASVCEGATLNYEDGGAARVLRYVNEWLAAAGWQPIDVEALRRDLAAKNDGATPGFDGWYVGIRDRRTANRLIQTLKRARDQAMGRDE